MSRRNSPERRGGSRFHVDWSRYSAESDRKYREVLEGRDFDHLTDHNIIVGCDLELRFVFDCAATFMSPLAFGSALDVCCGAGTMTDALRRAGFAPIGIELNADAVRLARARYPDCSFIVGDAADVASLVGHQSFDLIMVREAHPFSRIDDFPYQRALIEQYLGLLRPGGVLVIAHARRGGGSRYPSLDVDRVREVFRSHDVEVVGPIVFFLIKHLAYRLGSRRLTEVLSRAARLLQRATNSRWIEFLFVAKAREGTVRQS